MELAKYLEHEIGECERRFRSVSLSLKINRDYVRAPDAAPEDVEYFRCQVELEVLEQEYLAKRLVALRKWIALSATSHLGTA